MNLYPLDLVQNTEKLLEAYDMRPCCLHEIKWKNSQRFVIHVSSFLKKIVSELHEMIQMFSHCEKEDNVKFS